MRAGGDGDRRGGPFGGLWDLVEMVAIGFALGLALVVAENLFWPRAVAPPDARQSSSTTAGREAAAGCPFGAPTRTGIPTDRINP